jgi:hypothetical protein
MDKSEEPTVVDLIVRRVYLKKLLRHAQRLPAFQYPQHPNKSAAVKALKEEILRLKILLNSMV